MGYGLALALSRGDDPQAKKKTKHPEPKERIPNSKTYKLAEAFNPFVEDVHILFVFL